MKTLILASLLFLVSCSKSTTEHTDNYTMPDEMKGCKVYTLQSEGVGGSLKVVHCPNASTSTTYGCGKNCTETTNVITR